MSEETPDFNEIIEKIAKESHGVGSLAELKIFLTKTFKKTQNAKEKFLENEFIREPILWEDVKGKVWDTEEERDANKFSFIQGDIISTTKVLRLGTSEYNQRHDLWIVRSPSCDCVRSQYVKVSPVIEVVNKNAPKYNSFKTALFFATPNRFPLPKSILDAGETREGFYVDLVEPFFLEQKDKEDAVVLKSLSQNGWHLFNALSVNLESRANVKEETLFRS